MKNLIINNNKEIKIYENKLEKSFKNKNIFLTEKIQDLNIKLKNSEDELKLLVYTYKKFSTVSISFS